MEQGQVREEIQEVCLSELIGIAVGTKQGAGWGPFNLGAEENLVCSPSQETEQLDMHHFVLLEKTDRH